MKKQSLLLIGGALLAFASCQPESSTDGMYTQEQVDSIVDARVMEQMMVLQNNNDSVINALAQMKADSMIAELKAGKPVTTKTTTTRTTTVNSGGNETTTTEKTNPKSGRFNGEGTTNTEEKAGRFNEDAAQKAKEQSTNKKAERFNR